MVAERESLDPTSPGRWDHLVGEMRAVRERAGDPSYAVLAQRVVDARIAAGADEHAARIARSSVHDAFRLGRSRINVGLVRELVTAMGEDPAVVDGWLAGPVDDVDPVPDPPAPEPAVVEPPEASRRSVLALLVACVALNLLGRVFVDSFGLPIYLDMVGTAIAAIAVGPWRGAAVGATTNVVGIVGSGLLSLPFALVNVVGALVWGYGVRRFGLGRTLARFFRLCVATAAACTAFAVPILLVKLGDDVRHGHDAVTVLVRDVVGSGLHTVALSNLLTSVADKLISGFVALVAISALPASLRRGIRLVAMPDDPPPDRGPRDELLGR